MSGDDDDDDVNDFETDEDSGPEEADFAKSWVNTDDTGDYEPSDVANIKEEWENLTIYLPDRLREEVELAFRETSYQCMEAEGHDLQKLREFYPLLIVFGLESLESIEGEEVTDVLRYMTAEYGRE